MQDQYNLVQRGEEQEMFPLLRDQGVGSLPWSPLAAGVVASPGGRTTPQGARTTRRPTSTATRYGRTATSRQSTRSNA
ncbi:aldo/keto reductase [Arthrobacter ginsengisoli]|uniref:aldo/keto reductase n=1 Tax=Arthrobacter ginsengisoli TaxID=1356565 RepID=UPI00286BC7CE|nr:aldo/keto reductase [Arthrobacter ginsengisoli]